jgi:hypothetical protein
MFMPPVACAVLFLQRMFWLQFDLVNETTVGT